MDVFASGVGNFTAAVAGYSHPDFFDSAVTRGRYIAEMVSLYGHDNLNRNVLYKPFPFRSRFGDIQLQYVSNSCGTMYFNWKLINRIRNAFYPRMEHEWVEATCGKAGTTLLLDDGIMSQTLSYFWMEYARMLGWDTDQCGPIIDIMPSVANHLVGGGLTGKSVEEGRTFVGSPTLPSNFDEYCDLSGYVAVK